MPSPEGFLRETTEPKNEILQLIKCRKVESVLGCGRIALLQTSLHRQMHPQKAYTCRVLSSRIDLYRERTLRTDGERTKDSHVENSEVTYYRRGGIRTEFIKQMRLVPG